MGHGVVPTSHPLFVPITVAHGLWPEVDVVIGIGSRIEWPLGTWGYDDDLQLIQINIDADEVDPHAYGNVRRIQRTHYGDDRVIASELRNPDFATFCDSFGVRHTTADAPSELRTELAYALGHNEPAVVEVRLGELPDPWPFLRMAPNR